jgi:hypothetical protein
LLSPLEKAARSAGRAFRRNNMSTKQISRLVVLAAVIISLVVLLVKLIQGTAGIVGSAFNTVLGIVVVIALVIIVIWMFAYAKKNRK